MSDSVALVVRRRVARRVQHMVEVSESLVNRLVSTKGISSDQAKYLIVASAARVALKLARNDEKAAVAALIIVNGQQNRLPQCTKLLRKHSSEVVKTAYAIKGDLAISSASLRQICTFVEKTDGDLDGEAAQLRDLLEEVAMRAISKSQEWHFHHRIHEGLEAGHLIETLVEEIRADLDQAEVEYEEMHTAQKHAFHGIRSS